MQISELELMEFLADICETINPSGVSLDSQTRHSPQETSSFLSPSSCLSVEVTNYADLLDGHTDLLSALSFIWSLNEDERLAAALSDVQEFLAKHASQLDDLNGENPTSRDYLYPVV